MEMTETQQNLGGIKIYAAALTTVNLYLSRTNSVNFSPGVLAKTMVRYVLAGM